MRLRTTFAAWTLALALGASPLAAGQAGAAPPGSSPQLRFATFHVGLQRPAEGAPGVDLMTHRDHAQARAVAETLQITRPDVVLLTGFDSGSATVDAFRANYLRVSQNGDPPIDYPFLVTADEATPGRDGMVLLSRYPIDDPGVRTFRTFLWKDMPGALPPPPVVADLPLVSQAQWDVPIRVDGATVHALVSSPTPPSPAGPEQRDRLRNHDEIRFWADYVTPGAGTYIYDDEGVRGGLNPGEAFVVMGDLNADPVDGDSVPGAIQQLLGNKRIIDPMPASDGATEAAALQGGANLAHRGDPAYDTVDLPDDITAGGPGNLRADYVLPSRKGLLWTQAGVFWPTRADLRSERLVVADPVVGGHRLVWVDLRVG